MGGLDAGGCAVVPTVQLQVGGRGLAAVLTCTNLELKEHIKWHLEKLFCHRLQKKGFPLSLQILAILLNPERMNCGWNLLCTLHNLKIWERLPKQFTSGFLFNTLVLSDELYYLPAN